MGIKRNSRHLIALLPFVVAGALLLVFPALLHAQAVLTNGDFEAGLSGWTTSGTVTTITGPTGTAASLSNGATISQTFSISVPGVYLLTFDVADNSSTSRATYDVNFSDEVEETATYNFNTLSSTGWASREGYLFLDSGNHTVVIRKSSTGASQLYIDNIELTVYSLAITDPGPVTNNRINGRSSWTIQDTSFVANVGNNSLVDHYGTFRVLDPDGYISQTVDLTQDVAYDVTFSCRSNQTLYSYNIQLHFGGNTENIVCSRDEWKENTFTITNTEGTTDLAFYAVSGNGTNPGFLIDDITISGGDEPWIPPGESQYYGYCTFPITTTQTITAADGFTQTTTITSTITRPANLLLNSSFETAGGSGPADWYTSSGINPSYWWILDANARTGSNSVRSYPNLKLQQDLVLQGAGMYAVGLAAKCTTAFCTGDSISINWNGVQEAIAQEITSTYQIFTGTNFAGTSITTIELDMSSGVFNGDVRVDDVFLVPINPDGSINCDPDLYPETGEAGDITAVDCVMYPYADECLVVPVGGAGSVCYSCAPPSDMSSLAVSYWLAWLGCVIRNMFSCSLRIWLMNLGNTLLALMGTAVMQVNWINSEANQIVGFFVQIYNRFAEWAGQVPGSVSVAVSVGRSSFDWFWLVFAIAASLFALLMSLMAFIIAGGASLVALLISIVTALGSVFTAPPLDLVAELGLGAGTEVGPFAAGTEIPGGYLVTRLLYGMALADSVVTDWGIYPVLIVVTGIMGFGVLMWVVYQWKDGIVDI